MYLLYHSRNFCTYIQIFFINCFLSHKNVRDLKWLVIKYPAISIVLLITVVFTWYSHTLIHRLFPTAYTIPGHQPKITPAELNFPSVCEY